MTVSFDLTGKVALITGSTRGIGRAVAEAFGEAGATVAINGRTAAASEAVAADFTAAGIKAIAAPFDVADRAAATSAVANIIAAENKIDILVNNAGIIHRQPVLEFAEADWQKVLDVNLSACFLLARDCGKSMADTGWGRIINMASIMGQVARPTIPPYVASKHGLIGLTKALAVELGPMGITANAVNPGYIETDINETLMNDAEFDAMVKSRTPVGRWGRTSEIAGACVFLASDAGAYVNGISLTVDGGMTAALY